MILKYMLLKRYEERNSSRPGGLRELKAEKKTELVFIRYLAGKLREEGG